jgi:hypothetical protein
MPRNDAKGGAHAAARMSNGHSHYFLTTFVWIVPLFSRDGCVPRNRI